MQKCYSVTLAGKVQHIGFRILIEDIARMLDVRGYAFNDAEGNVRMVCCGDNDVINDFFDEVKIKGDKKGITFKTIDKIELPLEIPLPEKFTRLYTDELEDISTKLDIGIDILKDIKGDTSALPRIETLLNSLVVEQRGFVVEQKEFNKEMQNHNKRLEKILEKLVERQTSTTPS